MNIIEKINQASCRKMTYDELKKTLMEISVENENLKITNELLIDNIKRLRQKNQELEINYNNLLDDFKLFKEEKERKNIENKKEKLFNTE